MRLGLCGLLIRLARALLIVVSVVIVFLAISARSQDSSTGAVRGFVSDASGGRLGRCSVGLANNATGIVRSAFLIDEKGKIAAAWYGVSPKDTVPGAISALAAA